MAVIGELKPFFGEIARLLRTLVNNTCAASAPAITTAGTGSIPAGLRSVAIVKTSSNADSVTITLSDGSTYTMTEQGEVFGDNAVVGGVLPAYTISGAGTIKWHGIL